MLSSIILLCSGTSSRMHPFENKFLFEFLGKTALEHQLVNILSCKYVGDIYIVGNEFNIPTLKEEIEKKFPSGFSRFIFTEQEDLDGGMMSGVLSVEKLWKEDSPVAVISSNDIVENWFLSDFLNPETFPQSDLKICGKTVDKYFPGGYLDIDCEKNVKRICEKPGEGNEPSNMINLVFHWYTSAHQLFSLLSQQDNTQDDGYERCIQKFIDDNKEVKAVEYSGKWQALKYPWHVLDMKNFFLEEIEKQKNPQMISKDAYISPKASISGNVIIEEGVKIFDFAVVQGPCYIGKNTIIGNHSLVRESHLGENCCIGQGTEIVRSYLRNKVFTHQSYIGDSVVDNDVNFGAGCRTGNLRHDSGKVSVMVKKEMVDSGKEKLGIFCGSKCRFGINTSFSPGISIGKKTLCYPHLFLENSIPEKSFVKGDKQNYKLDIRKNREE